MSKNFFVLIVLTLFIGTVGAEELAGMDVDRGYQRAGSDYTHYHAKNAKHCARDCFNESRCRAFDYNRRDETCWLKDRVPAKRRNSDINTGRKPGHNYDYGYGGSDKQVAKASGYCVMRNRDSNHVVWESQCHIKQTLSGNKQVFVITSNNGVKYKFVQKNGENWTANMGRGYKMDAHYKDRGNEGVFKWDRYKLQVWADGR